jgi:WD40 repeat protein
MSTFWTWNSASNARRWCGKAVAALFLLSLALEASVATAQGRPDLLWTEAGHSDAVTAMDFSPDGTVLATSSEDRTLKLWRYPGRALLRTLVLPDDIDAQVVGVSMVRFTPDGARVVAAVNQYNAHKSRYFGTVRVFRVSDGALVRTLGRQAERIASIDISPDGVWVASAADGGAMVWRLADGTLVKALEGHPGKAVDVRFSPGGERLCAGYEDKHLAAWSTSDWHLEWDVKAHDESITRTAFSPDGALIATTSWDGTARLFNAADGAPRFVLPVGAPLYAATFSPDGQNLATGGTDRTVRLWDVASGGLVRQFADSGGAVVSLRYTDTGQSLLSGGGYPSSRIGEWNPADGTRQRNFTRLASPLNKVAYSPDSAWVAVAASYDQKVDVFDAASGRLRFAWNTHADASDVAFSPTRPLVAMPGAGNTVVIRSLTDGKKVRTLVGHEENVVGLGFSHDGALLASGSFFPGTIRLWRTSDWSLVREIKAGFDLGAFGPFMSFSFSPDDQLLGSIAEGAALVISVADGSAVAHPPGISSSATFSPDGQLFVTSGGVYQDEVSIFRVSDWALTRTLPTGANGVAFSADGKRLLAAHLDALRIWRTSDWTVSKTYDEELGYTGSGMGVQTVAMAPDAGQFAYGRDDATLAVARNPHQDLARRAAKPLRPAAPPAAGAPRSSASAQDRAR